jgi:hypothetical protein
MAAIEDCVSAGLTVTTFAEDTCLSSLLCLFYSGAFPETQVHNAHTE